MASGIIKALFGISKGQMKTIPWTKMTPQLHDQLSSQLGKLMFVIKSQNLKLTKFQEDYLKNQLRHMNEFEKRVLTKTETPKPKGEVHPFMGFKPKIVPKETVTASPKRIKQGFSTQMKLNRPEENQALIKSFIRRENAEFNALNREQQKEIFDMFDTWAKKDTPDPADFASGGIARVPMIFGGSAGLKALIKRMKGKNKRIFSGKIGVDKRELAKTLMPRELEQLQNLKISQLENLLEALKLDKEQMAMRASHKAMNDPGLDFMLKKLDEMPGSGLTSDADLAKYVDIDKDILTLEQMIKNKKMVGRRPNAKGGRIGYANGLKVYPKIDITETGQTPAEGINVREQDITVGGTGVYQGPNWFAGAEGLTGKTKVDVTADGKTLYKDTMSKDDALNYIVGLGELEGDKFQIKSDEDFDNVQIVLKKKFNQGGRASLSNGGLAKILGV